MMHDCRGYTYVTKSGNHRLKTANVNWQ